MTIEIILLLIILLIALTLYVVLGGADFGAGVWEFNTALRASERERRLLYSAIGPVWETNHVWLIFVLVLLFGAFPAAYRALHQALYVPLLLGLAGIVFRGAAFAFRSQLKSEPQRGRIWVAVFALASVAAPLFLGAGLGAVASGQLDFDGEGKFIGDPLFGWVNSLSVFTGFFAVGLCAYGAAAYMIREAHAAGDQELQQLWRRRALAVGLLMGVLAMAGLMLVALQYPVLREGMLRRAWPVIGVSLASGIFSLWAIYSGRINSGVIGASITSATVVMGWGVAQYPYLIPGVWSAEASASPVNVLRIILVCILVGAIFLLPSLYFLWCIFKATPRPASVPDNRSRSRPS